MNLARSSFLGALRPWRFALSNSAILAAILPLALPVITTVVAAQDPPSTGTYAILSGTYREIGGFIGVLEYPLPQTSQAYVALVTSPGNNAQLLFLDAAYHPYGAWITNGVVSGNTIEFHYSTPNPILPTFPPAWVNYTLTNAAGFLGIGGSITSTPVCCDIPYWFEHSNVAARFMPVLVIRAGNGIELAWTSASNQNYQPEYISNLTQAAWTSLGEPVLGNGTTNVLTDSEAPAPPQRLYRLRILP